MSIERFETRREGDQVGDNDDAVAVYKIVDGHEDKIAICDTQTTADKLVATMEPAAAALATILIELGVSPEDLEAAGYRCCSRR